MNKPFWRKTAGILAKYFDDLLALAAGGCLTASAAVAFGLAAALAAAGVCLGIYAVSVARAKGGR